MYRMENLDTSQATSIILILALLFGLIVLPLIIQKLYNLSAIKVTFAVIIIYVLINWKIKEK